MNLEIENYLVLESNAPSLSGLKEGKHWKYSVSGPHIYPIDVSIPIIRKGEGCVGLAVIQSLMITSYRTDITFNVYSVDNAAGKAYYNLYRDNINTGMNKSDDEYADSEDVLIPGLMGSSSRRSSFDEDERPHQRPRPKFNSSSLKKNKGWD